MTELVTDEERLLVQHYIEQGSEAYLDGTPREECPLEGYFVRQAWITGWIEASHEREKEF